MKSRQIKRAFWCLAYGVCATAFIIVLPFVLVAIGSAVGADRAGKCADRYRQ